MLGNSLSYALKVEETKYLERFKGFVTAQAAEMELSYFITCYYGRSFDGNFLTGDERQRRWDWGEVVKTHAFIKKQIHKCNFCIYFCEKYYVKINFSLLLFYFSLTRNSAPVDEAFLIFPLR